MTEMVKGYETVNPFDYGLEIDDMLLIFELRSV